MITNVIITAASVVSAVCIILGVIIKPFKKLNEYARAIYNFKEHQNDNFIQLKDAIQESHNEMDNKFDELRKDLISNRLTTLRVELNQMIHNDPKNHDTICKLFQEYKELGGNKYMDVKFELWKKNELKDEQQ